MQFVENDKVKNIALFGEMCYSSEASSYAEYRLFCIRKWLREESAHLQEQVFFFAPEQGQYLCILQEVRI